MPEDQSTDKTEDATPSTPPAQGNPAKDSEAPGMVDPEISKLREAVLSWIEKAKNISPTIDELKVKKQTKKINKEKEIEIKNPIARVEAIRPTKSEIPIPAPKLESSTDSTDKNEMPIKLQTGSKSKKLIKPKLLNKSTNKVTSQLRPVFGGQNKPPLNRIPPKKSSKGLNKHIKKIIFLILIFIFIGLLILGTSIYLFRAKNSVVMAITKVIPMPVAVVNWQPVSYFSWRTQINSLENFYQKQTESNPEIIRPNIQQTEQHILERMIENTILKQEAKKYKIEISKQELESYISILVDEIGSQSAFESQIKNLYNWTTEEFIQEIVRPLLLKLQLASAIILDDRINEQARLTAQQALSEVREAKLPFEIIAQKYSEDITAVQGGDLGYFSRGQLEPSFEQAAFALKPGEVSELVQTRYGYHIIKVEETLLDENDVIVQIRAKHILIRGKDLDTYLAEIKKGSKIWRLISI